MIDELYWFCVAVVLCEHIHTLVTLNPNVLSHFFKTSVHQIFMRYLFVSKNYYRQTPGVLPACSKTEPESQKWQLRNSTTQL